MKLRTILSAAALATGLAGPALAQQCGAFEEALVFDKGADQLVLSPYGSELLLKNEDAIACLTSILSAMKSRITSPVLERRDLARFVQVTGALRTVLANGGLPAIAAFREADNLDTMTVLAYGARSDDQNARVNAALILADVIDNSGLCVVIDHLYDPAVNASDAGKSGRLNLLGIASVAAPWAYRENFQNLERLDEYFEPIVKRESNSQQTRSVLANLEERMAFQRRGADMNKNAPLPGNLRQCYQYTPIWANKDGERLVYRD